MNCNPHPAQESRWACRPGLSPLRYTTTYHVSRGSLDKLREVGEEMGFSVSEGDSLRFLGTQFVAADTTGRRTTPQEGDLADIVAVVREARNEGIGRDLDDEAVPGAVDRAMWEPRYPELVPTAR